MLSTSLLEDLNPEQADAVITDQGPVLVLAGAGSGKTKTLVHRIARLLSEKLAYPDQILAVTFTNKAAKEMRSRIADILNMPSPGYNFMPFMGTFHSIAARMLRIDGSNIGVASNFVIFDTDDSKSLIKQAMKSLGIDSKEYDPRQIANLISSAKNELVDPIEYQSIASENIQQVTANIYKKYQSMLQDANALDFDDLLFFVVKMLKNNDSILEKWQDKFKYILIDEYQDTNTAQYQFAKILAAKHNNICVVGDDWQSIYSWRGADFRNILNFHRDYPDLKTIKLEQNYRSTKAILAAAQSVISKNTTRSEKVLRTDNPAGAPVNIYLASSERDEAEQIVQSVKYQVNSGKRKYNDFAVLYRTNAQSRALEEIFIRYGLPYKILGGTRFYDRKEIKDIIAYLRLIYQPNDRASFKRIINTPTRGIGATSVQKIFDAIDTNPDLSLEYLLKNPASLSFLGAKAQKSIFEFSNMLLSLKKYHDDNANLAELIDAVIRRTKYLDFLDDGTPQAEDRQQNIKELASAVKDQPSLSLNDFLEEVALISDLDNYNQDADCVTLMTLHTAKGLEFPVVFIVGMEEGIFPHSSSFFDNSQLEEERRLCYVGLTRAREELHLTHAMSRMLWGSSQSNPPSRFLADIDAKYASKTFIAEPLGQTAATPKRQDSEPRMKARVNDKVFHNIFGTGVIIDIDEPMATIKFQKGGVKTLNLEFAPLQKV